MHSSLDILSKSFATDVFKGTILKHDVSRGDGKENQYPQETNPEEWSALRSTWIIGTVHSNFQGNCFQSSNGAIENRNE